MPRLIVSRIGTGVLTLVLVSLLIFGSVASFKADSAQIILGKEAAAQPELVQQLREKLYLNHPLPVRYVHWATGFLRGNLGTSAGTLTPVSSVVARPFVNTLTLAGITFMLLLPLSILIGTFSAIKRYGKFDTATGVSTIIFSGLPEFVTGIWLVLILALWLHLLPATSLFNPGDYAFQHPRELVLPVLTLISVSLAYNIRLIRGIVLETFDREFVDMLRMKGVPERVIVWQHVVPNSLVATIQISALSVVYLLSGVVVVEYLFNYPGIGTVLANAVSNRDIPTVQAIVLVVSAAYIIANLVAEILTILVTPRLRTSL